MSNKISITITNDRGERFRIDHVVSERDVALYRGRTVSIAVGDFSSITLPVHVFVNLIQAADSAAHMGLSYPEDVKSFYGLGD